MPKLINKATGQAETVAPEGLSEKLYSKQYTPDPAEKYNVRNPVGSIEGVGGDALMTALGSGYELETSREQSNRMAAEGREEVYGTVRGKVQGTVEALGRGATLGGLDLGLRLLGEDPEAMRSRREHLGVVGTALEFAGAAGATVLSGGAAAGGLASSGLRGLAARTPAGLLARAGSATTKKVAEITAKGLVGKVLAPVAGLAAMGAVEGAGMAFGEGLTRVSQTSEPITAELLASELGDRTLSGGLVGLAAGTAAGVLTKLTLTGGLMRIAKAPLERYAARAEKGAAELGDLANASRKELRLAEEAELLRIDQVGKRERVELANDLMKLRRAHEGAAKLSEVADAALAKEVQKAQKELLSATKNPQKLAKNPRRAEAALEKSREALGKLVENPENPGLDKMARRMLEQTEAAQGRMAAAYAPAVSPRLNQIEEARQLLRANRGPMLAQKVLDPEQLLDKVLSGRARSARRIADAIGVIASASDDTARLAPITALPRNVGPFATYFRPPDWEREQQLIRSRAQQQPVRSREQKQLEDFRERAKAIRSMTVPNPDGSMTMKQTARQAVAQGLAPLRQVDALLADRMESVAARRVEFLATKLPKRPDIAVPLTASDNWRPSRYEVDKFARYAAAVEDPIGVIERVTNGVVTPEDVEVLRNVYPEMYQDTRQKLYEKLATVRETLPYKKRLALSIFFDAPVVPSMDPKIMRVLQQTYAEEPGTEGGVAAPVAKPQFGSISKTEEPTPAQERAG